MEAVFKIEADLINENDENLTYQTDLACNLPSVDNKKQHVENLDCKSYETNGIEPVKPVIQLHAKFSSFAQLREAIDIYQKENFVQLIVKDSKLLKSESTRKVGFNTILSIFSN